jgi:hypothetical protein
MVMAKEEKKYVVLSDGQHEYDILDSTNNKGHRVMKLFYSQEEFWNSNIRGKMALKMVDSGNGVRFSKNAKSLEYDELAEMHLLMNFSKSTSENPAERNGKYEIYSRIENCVSGESITI